jgi:hypothetical protein
METWYYVVDGEQKGPVSGETIILAVIDGTIKKDTLVWKEGLTSWVPYNQSTLVTGNTVKSVPPPFMQKITKPKSFRLILPKKLGSVSGILFILGILIAIFFAFYSYFYYSGEFVGNDYWDGLRDMGLLGKSQNQIDAEVLESVKSEFKGKGIDCTISKLMLIKTGKNQYHGMISTENGSDLQIEVAYDGKKLMWSIPGSEMLKIQSERAISEKSKEAR